MLVRYVVAVSVDIVIEYLGHLVADRGFPLGAPLVLEWGSSVGTVHKREIRSVGADTVVVAQVQSTDSADSSAHVPHQDKQGVTETRVVVVFEVFEDSLGAFRFEHDRSGPLALRRGRDRDTPSDSLGTATVVLAELDEEPEGPHFVFEGGRCDFVGSVEFVLEGHLPSYFAHVGEHVLVFDPLSEPSEPSLMFVHRGLADFCLSAFQVELYCFVGRDLFESWHGWNRTT